MQTNPFSEQYWVHEQVSLRSVNKLNWPWIAGAKILHLTYGASLNQAE